MKHRRLIAIILTLTLLLDLIPSALAAVGTGWDDDCRGNKQMDTLGNVIYGQHDWVQRSETPGSSCTSKGTAEYRCSYCGANVTRATKAPDTSGAAGRPRRKPPVRKMGRRPGSARFAERRRHGRPINFPIAWGIGL